MTDRETDRELLELAAKAAGYDVRWHETWGCFVHVNPYNVTNPPTLAGQRMVWVPLTDDGDALRLAVKLRLNFSDSVLWSQFNDQGHYDPYAATRRVIVKAAAEIGGQQQ